VISFSSGLSPAHAKSYYTHELAAPENRLAAELESGRVRHHGAVATHLGLGDPRSHTAETFRNLCDGRSPDGESVLVPPRNGWEGSAARRARGGNARNAGWDINVSPDKSVSVAALVLGDDRIVEVHRDATRAVLSVLERSICTRSADGRRAERTGALLATTFDHGVSRELDPQLHTHLFLHNITVDRTGRTRAVYLPPTFRVRGEAADAYSASLERGLARLGYPVTRSPGTAVVRIEGIPQALLERFSTRSRRAREQANRIRSEARAQVDRQEPTARTLHRWAASASRPAKPRHLDGRELRLRWIDQARELGIEPSELLRTIRNAAPPRAPEPQADPDRVAVPRDRPTQSASGATSGGAAPAIVATVEPLGPGPDRGLVHAAFAAGRETAAAAAESVTGDFSEGLRPLDRSARVVAEAAALAAEAVASGGFLTRLRSAATRDTPPPDRSTPVAPARTPVEREPVHAPVGLDLESGGKALGRSALAVLGRLPAGPDPGRSR